VEEEIVTRAEFPLEKARQVLKHEMVAVLGYEDQGPAQAKVRFRQLVFAMRLPGLDWAIESRSESNTNGGEDGWHLLTLEA
jgi:hypothetical protein